MATLTEKDYINANLMADRILLRKLFEELRDRPQSKYFKNVVIKDIEWNKKTFCGNNKIPLNISPVFLSKYPYDFEISYDILGCNMLKCYYNCSKKRKFSQPVLINDYIYAQSESCYAIYDEFNNYLVEKFNLNKNNVRTGDDHFPFETFSIHSDKGDFCGIQFKKFKEYSILPSSRWINEDDEDIYQYVEKYKDDPGKLSNVAGLVNAPPLNWNTEKQNVNFNRKYCSQFIKEYNS